MNPEKPQSPREELEVRLTALILGELAADEAQALRRKLAEDPGLARLHERLAASIELLRQAVTDPETEQATRPPPLKLAGQRRQQLLQHFKTVAPNEFAQPRRREVSWIVPMGIAAVLVVLMGLALFWDELSPREPYHVSSRQEENLTQLTDNNTIPRQRIERNAQATRSPQPVIVFNNRARSSPPASSLNNLHPNSGTGSLSLGKTLSPAALTESPFQALPAPGGSAAHVAFTTSTGTLGQQNGARASSQLGQFARGDATPAPSAGTAIVLPSVAEAAATERERFMKRYGLAESSGMVVDVGGIQGRLAASAASPAVSLQSETLAKGKQQDEADSLVVGTAGQSGGFGGVGGIAQAASKIPAQGVAGGTFVPVNATKDTADPTQILKTRVEERLGEQSQKPALDLQTSLRESVQLLSKADAAQESAPERVMVAGDLPMLGSLFRSRSQASDAENKPQSSPEMLAPARNVDLSDRLRMRLTTNVAWADYDQDGFLDLMANGTRQNPSSSTPLAVNGSSRVGRLSIALPPAQPEISIPHEEKAGGDLTLDTQAEISKTRAKSGTQSAAAAPAAAMTPETLGRLEGLATDARSEYRRLAGLTNKVASLKESADKLDKEIETAKEANGRERKKLTEGMVFQPETPTRENAFSTFSLNVSDVSFKLAAASLEKGVVPDPATVRSEEFINAFDYRDPEPQAGVPVAFAWERAAYPFAQNRDLLRLSLKTAALGRQPGRPLNLVLLLDNSGSMERADRVSIIREALKVLASQLQSQDKFSVVTFARTARLFVDGVPGDQSANVVEELGRLTPEGGTNLEEAMRLGYQTALRHYLADGVNRVVLLTDGAANLGNIEADALKQKVEAHRKQGIALDCYGIGWEGYNDDLLEVLTRNGDGRYGFINSPQEAASGFAGQLAGALHVAASDVKVQVEFNPARVAAYRQIGYAKHQLTKEQFRDNAVDAAEMGAAESGNALYVLEVNPAGNGPLGTVRIRYKVPGTTEYREHEWVVPFTGNAASLDLASSAMHLAATAGAFSEWLASSPFAGEVTLDRLLGYLGNVPEIYGADARPKKLEWMLRQAKSITGK